MNAVHNLWNELNQTLSDALHKLLVIPSCCMCGNAPFELPIQQRHSVISTPQFRRNLPRPVGEAERLLRIPAQQGTSVPGRTRDDDLQTAWYSTYRQQEHRFCDGCVQDILTRAHTGEAHRHVVTANAHVQDWLLNTPHQSLLSDLYEATPHTNGFEQNIEGFGAAHLERVEQYWFDHQLSSPTGARNNKPSCRCAPVGSW
jgi:hypothetical protein